MKTAFVSEVSSSGYNADASPNLVGATVTTFFSAAQKDELTYQWVLCDEDGWYYEESPKYTPSTVATATIASAITSHLVRF